MFVCLSNNKKPFLVVPFFFTSSKIQKKIFVCWTWKKYTFQKKKWYSYACLWRYVVDSVSSSSSWVVVCITRLLEPTKRTGREDMRRRNSRSSLQICRPKTILQKTQVKHTSSLPNLFSFISRERENVIGLGLCVSSILFCHEPISDACHWVFLSSQIILSSRFARAPPNFVTEKGT